MSHLWFEAESSGPSGMQRFAFVDADGKRRRVSVGYRIDPAMSPAALHGRGANDVQPSEARQTLAEMGWAGVTEVAA